MNGSVGEKLAGKRLVIFGCGYVGGELARQAAVRGVTVTALTRNEAIAVNLRAVGIETVVADLAGDMWHERIPGGPDFAVDCVSSGGDGLDGYRRSYVGGMSSILRWAQQRGKVGTLVYTSSTSVYPQGGGVRVDENASSDEASDRGKILLEAEAALRQNAGAAARWFILRLAGIYGPGRHALLNQVRDGKIPGRGEHRLNLAHRDDVCAAIWAALLAATPVKNEIFNVADDGAAPKSEIAAWLANKLRMPAPEFRLELEGGRRPVTPDRIIASDKIRTRLGWRPRYSTFREGYENILSR